MCWPRPVWRSPRAGHRRRSWPACLSLRAFRAGSHHVQRVAGALVVLSGVYLIYYFWVVDVNEESSAVTSRVDSWCYVSTPRGVQRRDIVLGRSNDRFVQVADGLSEGDRVVLNPETILDATDPNGNRKISPEADIPEALASSTARRSSTSMLLAKEPARLAKSSEHVESGK